MKTLIGVDIGTQGTKAALFDEGGTLLASAFRPSTLRHSRDGSVEEDPEQQLSSVCHTIAECVRKSKTDTSGVAGIAIDGQMAGILGVGKDGRHVTWYDSWLDTRCTPYIEHMDRAAGEEILTQTGGPVGFNHGPKILWWMRKRPAIYRSIRAFVQPGGYAALRLCGAAADRAFIDDTYLHFSGFANNRARRWNSDLCERFQLDESRLPRIVRPSDIVGELTGRMARRCALRGGVPIVAGCGDSAASFLACGATRGGVCVDVAGSASVFSTVTRRFKPDVRHRVLSCGRAATEGLWHSYAYINGGGVNLEWFRDLLTSDDRSKRARVTLPALDRLASKLDPTAEGPLFIPHLNGRTAPAGLRMRGAWLDLNRTHRIAHLWRAMLESVALEYATYRKILLSLHPSLALSELRVTGGGERSDLWNQIKADVLGIEVMTIARTAGAPTGAAMLAAHAVGLITDLDAAARRWLSTDKVIQPNRALALHYRARLKRYQTALMAIESLN